MFFSFKKRKNWDRCHLVIRVRIAVLKNKTGRFARGEGNKGGTCIWPQPGFLRIYHLLVTISDYRTFCGPKTRHLSPA